MEGGGQREKGRRLVWGGEMVGHEWTVQVKTGLMMRSDCGGIW